MDNSDVYNFLTPNISFDPTISLAGSQASQFDAGIKQLGTSSQQAYGIEYQLPYAIRYASPVAIASSSFANNIGVPDPVGNGTGAGEGSGTIQGPPGPPGSPGAGISFNPADAGDIVFVGATGSATVNSNLIYTVATGIMSVNKISQIPGASSDLNLITTDTTSGTPKAITITPGTNTMSGVQGGFNVNNFSGDTQIFGKFLLIAPGSTGGVFASNQGNITIRAQVLTENTNDNFNGSTGAFTIKSGDTTANDGNPYSSGDLNLTTGTTGGSGGSSMTSGSINISTGLESGTTAASPAINILLNNLNTGASSVKLEGDNSSTTVGKVTMYGQSLVLLTNQTGAGGRIFIHTLPANAYSALLGQGIIYIADASTNPTNNPVAGGILYSAGGALHWLGSAGTNTVIAPA